MYKCECGQEFETPNKFNNHKSNCEIHYKSLGKDFNLVQQQKKIKLSKIAKCRIQRQQKDKQQEFKDKKLHCEHCGKLMEVKFGSGRFCSRKCANSRKHTQETKNKISKSYMNTLKNKPRNLKIKCEVCGREFSTEQGYNYHKGVHDETLSKTIKRLNRNYRVGGVELNVTTRYIEQYFKTHQNCEICGKTVNPKPSSKHSAKRLCVDHNHKDNTFRGLLCQQCNRALGWYENNKDNVDNYLNK